MSPQGQHSLLGYRLAEQINRTSEPTKTALAFVELRTTSAGRSLVPAISVYLWHRVPRTATGRVANSFVEARDITIEIVSPEQSVTPLVRKCVWYVVNGVRASLLVDSGDESIIVFRVGQLPLVARGSDVINLTDIVPGLVLTPETIFELLTI